MLKRLQRRYKSLASVKENKEKGGFELLFVLLLFVLVSGIVIATVTYLENAEARTQQRDIELETAQQEEQVFAACVRTQSNGNYTIAQLISGGFLPQGYPKITPVGNAFICDNYTVNSSSGSNKGYIVTWNGIPTNVPLTRNSSGVVSNTELQNFTQSIASIMQAALVGSPNTNVGVVPANINNSNQNPNLYIVNQNYIINMHGLLYPESYPLPVIVGGMYNNVGGSASTGASTTSLTSGTQTGTSGGLSFPNGTSSFPTQSGNTINANGSVILSNGQTVQGTLLGNSITYVNASGTTVNYTFSNVNNSSGYTRTLELGTTYEWSCAAGPWGSSQSCAAGGASSYGGQWIWGASDGVSGTNQSGYYVMDNQFNNTTGAPITATLTFSADNFGWVWLNGQQVASAVNPNGNNWQVATTATITLPIGINTISFLVLNQPPYNPNPAAGILAIAQGNKSLLASNSKWWYTTAPPASPNPPMSQVIPGYTPYNCSTGTC